MAARTGIPLRGREVLSEKFWLRLALDCVVYLITFCCYGSHLPGDGKFCEYGSDEYAGAVDRMREPAYVLDDVRRNLVLIGIQEACCRRKWGLLAAHVRTSHVHCVVSADANPDLVMNGLKCYASHALNQIEARRIRWARHGSTRYLPSQRAVEGAVRYVVEGQGDVLAACVG